MLDQLLQRIFDALMNCGDDTLVYMLAVAVACFTLLFTMMCFAGHSREGKEIKAMIAMVAIANERRAATIERRVYEIINTLEKHKNDQ